MNPGANYDARAARYDRRWRRFSARSAEVVLRALPEDLPRAPALLDLGCGTGTFLALCRQARPDLALCGVDPSAKMLAVARDKLPGVRLLQASGNALPFPDATFGAVVSLSALHYFPEPLQVLAEVRRVLRAGGTLVLQDYVPNGWPGFALWMRWLDRGARHIYTPGEMAGLLSRAGFQAEPPTAFRIGAFWRGGLVRGRTPGEARLLLTPERSASPRREA